MATLPRSSRTSVVDKATIDGVDYAIKTYSDYHLFCAEVDAYEHFQNVEDLQACIPHYYGLHPSASYAIRLELLHGQLLHAALPGLSAATRNHLHSRLRTIIDRVHDAGVHHGDVHPENIIVGDGGRVWLLDFSLSGRRSRLNSTQWTWGKAEDIEALDSIFHVADSDEAVGQALAMLKSPSVEHPLCDDTLTPLLDKILWPPAPLLSALQAYAMRPQTPLMPRVTLWLAARRAYHHRYSEAVRLLLHCAERYKERSKNDRVGEQLEEEICQLTVTAARYAADGEARLRPQSRPPSSSPTSTAKLFADAVAHLTRLRRPQAAVALRFEWAQHLSYRHRFLDALAVCETAVRAAGPMDKEEEEEDGMQVWPKFAKLTWELTQMGTTDEVKNWAETLLVRLREQYGAVYEDVDDEPAT